MGTAIESLRKIGTIWVMIQIIGDHQQREKHEVLLYRKKYFDIKICIEHCWWSLYRREECQFPPPDKLSALWRQESKDIIVTLAPLTVIAVTQCLLHITVCDIARLIGFGMGNLDRENLRRL